MKLIKNSHLSLFSALALSLALIEFSQTTQAFANPERLVCWEKLVREPIPALWPMTRKAIEVFVEDKKVGHFSNTKAGSGLIETLWKLGLCDWISSQEGERFRDLQPPPPTLPSCYIVSRLPSSHPLVKRLLHLRLCQLSNPQELNLPLPEPEAYENEGAPDTPNTFWGSLSPIQGHDVWLRPSRSIESALGMIHAVDDPELGPGYRMPRKSLVWFLSIPQSRKKGILWEAATKKCQDNGARLPTIEESQRIALDKATDQQARDLKSVWIKDFWTSTQHSTDEDRIISYKTFGLLGKRTGYSYVNLFEPQNAYVACVMESNGS